MAGSDLVLAGVRIAPCASTEIHRLHTEHADLLHALTDACSSEDRKLGGVEIDHPVVFGSMGERHLLGRLPNLRGNLNVGK